MSSEATSGTVLHLRSFLLLAGGQIVSILGSRLTSFALGVWIYQSTGSTTSFALMLLATSLPGVAFQPVAGVLVDRWDRRRALIVGDSGSAVGTLMLLAVVASEVEYLWPIYLILGFRAFFDAIQSPAMEATLPLLVPREHLGRANGLVDLGSEGSRILAPPIAGALLGIVGLHGLLAIDFATFLIALATLLILRLPPLPATKPEAEPEAESEEEADGSSSSGRSAFKEQLLSGWHYLKARPAFLLLLILFAVTNFALGMVIVLFTPLVLSFASPLELGYVLSAASGGGMLGALVMVLWGGPKRRLNAVFVGGFLQGVILLLGGLRPNLALVAGAAFSFMFLAPIIGGSNRALWQSMIAPEVQGRVFAMRRTVSLAALPLAFLLAGPLADHVFTPWMLEGGALAGTVGQVLGTGPGRGVGLLLIVLGFVIMTAMTLGFLYPPLRHLEDELPETSTEESSS